MVTKGGYKLIDFGGVSLHPVTSVKIDGIYNKIKNTGKRIVGCNIEIGSTKFKEITLDVKEIVGVGFELSNSILKITISNTDYVVGKLVENIEVFTDKESFEDRLDGVTNVAVLLYDISTGITYTGYWDGSSMQVDSDGNYANWNEDIYIAYYSSLNLIVATGYYNDEA